MRKVTLYYTLLFLCLTSALAVHAQRKGYWQQRVEYVMNIDFDDAKHQFTGTQKLTYHNESGDTLRHVYYHLYFNAFRPNSAMDQRTRQLADADARMKKIQTLKPEEEGWHQIKSLTQDGVAVTYKIEGSILEVKLAKPILPGSKTVFDMQFQSQVPVQIRRSGRYNAEGVAYSMSQWYPKLCEYDNEGWHPDPYVGREFYGVWGDFDVTISLNKKFIVGSTGVLQNPQEIGYGYEDQTAPMKLPTGDKLKWHFVAQNVHDFAWGADAEYQHDVLPVQNGPVIHFLYKKDKNYSPVWKQYEPYMPRFFTEMSRRFGKYPYPVFTFIQGGDGGMEYPMLTLITGNRGLGSLVGVSVHEAIHNWYYGVLASNESKYPWMDEGFTTYASEELMDFLFEKNNQDRQLGSYQTYLWLDSVGMREPMSTHGDWYHNNTSYGVSAYPSGAVFLHQLSYIIGQDKFDEGMRRYFDEWKFKHPAPQDFIRSMEKSSGMVLQWYLEEFIYSTNSVDYALQEAKEDGKQTIIKLINVSDFPMPIDVEIELKDGTKLLYTIPLDIMRGAKERDGKNTYTVLPDWNWVSPAYEFTIEHKRKEIRRIEIDPSQKLADKKRVNNKVVF